MAEAVLIRTVTFTEKLYRSNGDVRIWLNRVTARFGREAKHYAPVRSGRLVAGISTTTRRSGVHQCEGTIRSTAPYTLFVLRGTTGPIMSNAAWAAGALENLIGPNGRYITGSLMPLPAYGPYKARLATTVSGQRANNFLIRAWAGTARDHRALRGRAIPTFITNP